MTATLLTQNTNQKCLEHSKQLYRKEYNNLLYEQNNFGNGKEIINPYDISSSINLFFGKMAQTNNRKKMKNEKLWIRFNTIHRDFS